MLSTQPPTAADVAGAESGLDCVTLLGRLLDALVPNYAELSKTILADSILVEEIILTYAAPEARRRCIQLLATLAADSTNAALLYDQHSVALMDVVQRALASTSLQQQDGEVLFMALQLLVRLCTSTNANVAVAIFAQHRTTLGLLLDRFSWLVACGERGVEASMWCLRAIALLVHPIDVEQGMRFVFPELLGLLTNTLLSAAALGNDDKAGLDRNVERAVLNLMASVLNRPVYQDKLVRAKPALLRMLLARMEEEDKLKPDHMIACLRVVRGYVSSFKPSISVASSGGGSLVRFLVAKMQPENGEEVRTHALRALTSLTKSSLGNARDVLAKHDSEVQSLLVGLLSTESEERLALASELAFHLTCAEDNLPILRRNGALIAALTRVKAVASDKTYTQALLALIHLQFEQDAASSDDMEQLDDRDLAKIVALLLHNGGACFSLMMPVLALVLDVDRYRSRLWAQLTANADEAGALLDCLKAALARALESTSGKTKNINTIMSVDTVLAVIIALGKEDAATATGSPPIMVLSALLPQLVDFCAALPAVMQQQQQPFIELVALLTSQVAEKAAAALSAKDVTYFAGLVGHIPGPVYVTMLHRDWDALLAQLAELPPHPPLPDGLLVACIQLRASIGVVSHLVRDQRCGGVNARFQDDETQTPLLVAMDTRRSDVALLLLDNGASVHDEDSQGRTALVLSCASSKLLSVTRRLVELGSAVNHVATGPPPTSPLTMCCFQLRAAGVAQAKCLLDAGACPSRLSQEEEEDASSSSSAIHPLFSAVRFGNEPMVRLLLERGANAKELTMQGGSVLEALGAATIGVTQDEQDAIASDNLEMLVQHGAADTLAAATTDPFIKLTSHSYYLPRLMRKCVELGARADYVLRSAVNYGQPGDVAWALQVGGDPNFYATGGDGEEEEPASSAPLLVRALERTDLAPAPHKSLVRMLLLAGADVEFGGSAAMQPPPLWVAIKAKRDDLVWMLLQAGASDRSMMIGRSVVQHAQMVLPSVLPWLSGGFDFGQLDPVDKGLEFVFTQCAACRKLGDAADLHGCSGCVMVAYCDADCQREHWKQHKTVCKKKQEMEEKRKQMN